MMYNRLKVILFDLDGTLLPMDQTEFTKKYFKLLSEKMSSYGYEPKRLIDTIWAGTLAMVKNNGSRFNEYVFWNIFSEVYGDKAVKDRVLFDEFYQTDFYRVKDVCGINTKAAELIKQLKNNGFRTALATNPIFPVVATENRIRWAGLEPGDFEICTTYENTCYCKPNPAYYRDIAERLGVLPEECLMVGNDVTEDMIARTVGMEVFLLTDCLINKEGEDFEQYSHGGFEELADFVLYRFNS